MGSFRRYRDIAIVVLLLAVPFFFLRAGIRDPAQTNALDRAILTIARPIQYGSAALARGVSSLIGDYVYLVNVKTDNDALLHENAVLRAKLRELERAQGENRRLRQLLGLRDTVAAETVSALVVGKDATEFFRVVNLTLDKPGVQVAPNMPVISFEGAVGKVLRVAGDSIDVMLAVDSGFGVDVIVERTGARGFVRGIGDRSRYGVRVEYVQRTDEVDVGDLLLTSGFGCHFPKAVPVARITKVIKRDFGMYQTVEAEPTVDFSRLEEVLIVLSDPKDCEPKARKAQAKR